MAENQQLDLAHLNTLDEASIYELATTNHWVNPKVNQYTKLDGDQTLFINSMVIFKNTTQSVTGCWELSHTVGISVHNNGYGRVSFLGSKKLAHHIAIMATKGLGPDWTCPEGHDVSHLCGNNKCVKPSHLVVESRANNMSRIGCKGYVTVQNTTATVVVEFCMCNHAPKCAFNTTVIDDNIDVQM